VSASELPVALGLGWGLLAATPIARRAGRTDVAVRFVTSRGEQHTRRHRVHSWLSRRVRAIAFGPVGRVVGGFVRRRVERRRDDAVAVELPVTIDLLAVAIGAGYTPYLAVEVAARWAPPLLAARLDDVRRSCALGAGFADALDCVADAVAPMRPLVDALLASDRYGAPVADALERLATEERAGLRRRAEARARKIPVLLLFPLVFLVLPAFGLLTVAPVLLAGFSHT
jgi:tight adherence protein C